MHGDFMGVALVRCKGCGNYWTEKHRNDEDWECRRCLKCGEEGRTVEIGKTETDGVVRCVWGDEGVVLVWGEDAV